MHSAAQSTSASTTLLATANAQLITSVMSIPVRMLIDTGSEITFIKEELITQHKLQRIHSTISVFGIGGNKATQTRGVVLISLRSNYCPATVHIQAHILRALTSNLPSVESPQQEWPHITGLQLADPDFLTSRPIDIVIGADTYGQIIKPNIRKGDPSMPIAQLSIFGWHVLGPITVDSNQLSSLHHSATVQHKDNALQDLLAKFWIQEELPLDTPTLLTPEEQECEDHFRATHTRDSTGRYIVRIPLRSSSNLLDNSYQTAHACLKRTLNKLNRDSEYCNLYQGFMKEYVELRHMVRAPSISPNTHSVFYLPHHGVIKLDSETTRLRVVFNGSSPTTSGHSINDLMHTGANLLLNITDVLLWIRQHKFIFATDVTKMYRQVKVHEDDQDLQRVLWIDDNYKEVPYKLTTVTYGTKAAPFLAVRALLQLVEDEGHRFPLAVPCIGSSLSTRSAMLRCVVCARQRGIRAHQMMGQLPLSRVAPSRPFTHTGIDYAGPITLKTWKGQGAKTQKGWICVFVCLTTSAVHFGTLSQTTRQKDSFAAYRRFTSRRGIPTMLHSDCGTNFVGADTILKRMFIQGTQDHQQLSQLFVNDNTGWCFNPPAAPHMGGKWKPS